MDSKIVLQARKQVLKMLAGLDANDRLYHDLIHTREVVRNAKKIAAALGLTPDEIEIVVIAAWFHDTGYLERVDGHEDLSAEHAAKFLTENGYPKNKIRQVTGCILATKVPQRPKNILQKIICDADLFHFGTKKFCSKNELLRIESEIISGKKLSEKVWFQNTIKFMNSHTFFTKYAREFLEPQKIRNIDKLKRKLTLVL